ncbi:methyltransferase domain-containing protein [Novosphingobium sp. 9U]|uniref:methyltransferase domain-containing protein n=1 Tax=Novosphingobium sp. 9U TaxID=2653158 RepID=UPI0012F15C7A|nr:methyltransferase domain-containing protein [Novosphingobium sp. 9U]VWX54017.1 Methyltransferase domain-containing protein [Novosphingobium sp. 9U]
MSARRSVTESFNRAAHYDQHAQVQRMVAEDLADNISRLPVVLALGSDLRILELGCGTGFLSQALTRRGLRGDWLVTDIAPAMVQRCRARMNQEATSATINYAVLDAANIPPLPGFQFDLICSSLAFQWLPDLPSTVANLTRCLAPGGYLAFTTLLAGSLQEWADAHRAEGLRTGLHSYPDAQELAAAIPWGNNYTITTIDYVEQHDSAEEFLRGIRGIGATMAVEDHHPLTPRQLNAVMRAFEDAGSEATYRVAHVRMGERCLGLPPNDHQRTSPPPHPLESIVLHLGWR